MATLEGQSETVVFWDTATFQRSGFLRGTPEHTLSHLAWTPDGHELLLGGWQGVDIWDVAHKTLSRRLRCRTR